MVQEPIYHIINHGTRSTICRPIMFCTYRGRTLLRSCLLCWIFLSLFHTSIFPFLGLIFCRPSASDFHRVVITFLWSKPFFNDRALVSASIFLFFPSSSSAHHLNVVFDSCNFSLDDTLAVILVQAADWFVHYYPGGGV